MLDYRVPARTVDLKFDESGPSFKNGSVVLNGGPAFAVNPNGCLLGFGVRLGCFAPTTSSECQRSDQKHQCNPTGFKQCLHPRPTMLSVVVESRVFHGKVCA